MFRKAALLLTGAAAAGSAYIYQDPDLRERASRSWTFWTGAAPILARYRWTDFRTKSAPKEERDAAFEALHDRYAPDALALILKLRGFYIKVGQVGSTRHDFVPKQYLDRLTTLQDGVPAEGGDFARRIVEAEFGQRLEDIFAEFDPKAIAAASVAQVHLARLRDGRDVVVKIQYPNVKRLFKLDLATMRLFARLAQPEQLPLINEIEKQFMKEFEFTNEAWAMQRIADNILPLFGDRVHIPRPIPPLVTDRVLVMERLQGEKLVQSLKRTGEFFSRIAPPPPSEGQALTAAQTFATGVAVALHVATARVWNVFARLWNGTVGVRLGVKLVEAYVPVFVDPARTMETLLAVHGHEILVDGIFNGDPHPGNILLMPDGRLGLIDFGQVKVLSDGHRHALAKLLVALAADDRDGTVRAFRAAGYATEKNSEYVAEKVAQVFFNRDDVEVTEGMNLQAFMEHLDKTDRNTAFPDDLLMAGRVSLLLRGLGTMLGLTVHSAPAWRQLAQSVLDSEAKSNPR